MTPSESTAVRRVPLRHIVRKLGSGKTPSGGAENYSTSGIPFLRSQNVWDDGLRLDDVVFIDDETHRSMTGTRVLPGDVLLNITGASIGRVALFDASLGFGEANVNQHVCIVRPRTGIDSRFLRYSLQGGAIRELLASRDPGATMEGINFAELRAMRVPVFDSLMQQRQASDFLDRKTAAIDALIAKQEQLLALLAEKRQALITQAVTKGLDPNVPMKDSGVVTLGRIPAHWHLTKLRRVGRVGQGDAFPHDLQGQGEGELPWFKVADMNRAGNEIEMLSADNYVSREVALAAKVTIFEPGAVIFPRVGAALLTNKRRLLTRPSIIDDNTYAVVPNNRIRSRFLYLSLLLVDMGSICSAGLVPTVTFSAIRDLDIALPPIAEQDAIIQHVEVECRRIDSLSQRVQAMIEKLREYRQALITAAVTGQLDVTSGAVATSAPKPYAEAVGT